jgi:phosphoribosyl-dephospho-CoA transferase
MLHTTATSPRPHDLLFFGAQGLPGPLPAWATLDWLARAPAVVRRDSRHDVDVIPVGLRGATRSERHRAWLPRRFVARCVTPEALAAAVANGALAGGSGLFPALQALQQLSPMLFDTGLAWGPGGGVGFALASGLPVLRSSSDLDLIVRAPRPLTAQQESALQRLCAAAPCRIDLQVETGQGAFAFAEWTRNRSGSSILLKTDAGPLLTDDPWRRAACLSV